MKLAISGTYSSGKTTTSIALSHLTGIPRTHAKTMREILPSLLPGRRLEDCTIPELLQLGMVRYAERAVHESHLPDGFISDGSSLHEWVYGKVRVLVGLHPGVREATGGFQSADERDFFAQVMDAIGAVMRRHAVDTYDAFAHLPIEFPLASDGHRPVSEEFRAKSDELLLDTLRQAGIPVRIIGGSLVDRLEALVRSFDLPTVMPVDEAIGLADAEMSRIDTSDELARRNIRAIVDTAKGRV
ncbi:ATP/GTP-binding protein [Couchioplanes caeruleus]|uniref:ATP/GTP-binding protein n=2 Tax=Couchioplanes caeruleus TaxID=56438 RepID=A0A1K0GWP1_9ACTN|nr:ATP-binding protein [Couchioplanes caeruleus]OJF15804.1 ATP/GTP-binding protein [Couchioplanes caeruleus subsp. caeruleus]ROP33029.1 AAA domain-containing protein [Couchioplanes caeruleus]